MAALTREEIRTYEDDGYVVPAYRVPEERMAVLRAMRWSRSHCR